MQKIASLCVVSLVLVATMGAVSKQHVVALGRATVKYLSGDDEGTTLEMKVRPLLVDSRIKEFTTGAAHDITERLFVIQKAYRLNDLLPQESGASRWKWQRGGWIMVDRTSGKVQAIALPLFDPDYSEVSWFRDYAAYCGASDDGRDVFTVVMQLGKRKPLLKKAIGGTGKCAVPTWMRGPARVTFEPPGEQKFTFTVRNHSVELAADYEDEGEN